MADPTPAAPKLPPASVDFNALHDALAAGKSPEQARDAALIDETVAISGDEAAARAAASAAEAPSLHGRDKSALLEIADRESVTVALDKDGQIIPIADATNDRIREAIQAKRDGAALPAPTPVDAE